MPNYQNSKIYKVWSPQTDEVYIGSTTQPLSKRMVQHRTDYKTNRSRSSANIIKFGDALGVDM